MKKKRYMVVLGAALILVVTILLLFLPFGSKEGPKEGTGEGTQEPGLSGENRTEQGGRLTGDTADTEAQQGGKELSSEVTTEDSGKPGDAGDFGDHGNTGSSEDPGSQGGTEDPGDGSGTEEMSEVTTEEVTEAPVDGAGLHQGKLGSNYSVPEGFFDISPEDHEEGYYYIYRNPERNMLLQVAEFRLEDRRVGFDGEYNVLHNLYLNDDSSYVTYDTKDDNHYVISGYLDHRTKVFYYEGYKYPDRNEVQIYSEYPNDGWKDSCDEFLDALLESYEYHFVSDPERNRKEEETTEDPYWEQYEDPSSVLDQFREE